MSHFAHAYAGHRNIYINLKAAMQALPYAKRFFADTRDKARIKFCSRLGAFYIQHIDTQQNF